MGANLKTVFVVDVEATCWSDDIDIYPGETERQGEQPNEIIEIGVAAMELKTGSVFKRASIVVRPRFTKISKFCTDLTGWTQEAIDEQGLDIKTALEYFQEQFHPTKNHMWFSWGEYDRYKLSSNTGASGLMGLYGIKPEDNPFDRFRGHINAKTLMALKERHSRESGMAAALRFYNLSLDGRHHNGADDAANIAKLVHRILS
jgi:inhibitor of KinA sporulation pathway (predicted exonuclease)